MGQKCNAHGLRVGPSLYKGWDSVLYAERDYSAKLHMDLKIRKLITSKYKIAQISRVVIERASDNMVINIYARKPGIIIGKSGSDIEQLKKDIKKLVSCELFINIHETKKPALDAAIVAQTVASQLEGRVSFRKAMKTAIQNTLKQGADGIQIKCSGRLGGAEIARAEWYREGRVPLHTLRADIDYSTSEALTAYGIIGVKVWIYRGNYNITRKIVN